MGTGRLSSFSIAGAGWMTRVTRPPRAQQEWLGSATGMAGNRRGFCRSLLLSERGELWAAPLLVLLASSRRRRRARRTVTGGVASSHMSCSRLLYLRGFFSPLSSSLGGVSSPASSLLLRGGTVVRVFQDVKRSCATMELCRPPVRFAWAGGTPRRVESTSRERRPWRGD